MCHDDTVKAAVIANLLAGQSNTEAGRPYNVSLSTVKRWRRSLVASGELVGVKPEPTSEAVKASIGDLIGELVIANLTALRAQAELFADKEWLKKQPANELALLHGIITDKTVRILEAGSRAAETPEE